MHGLFLLRPRHDVKPPSLLLVAWDIIYDSRPQGYTLFFTVNRIRVKNRVISPLKSKLSGTSCKVFSIQSNDRGVSDQEPQANPVLRGPGISSALTHAFLLRADAKNPLVFSLFGSASALFEIFLQRTRAQDIHEADELYLAKIIHTLLNACPANTHEIDTMQVISNHSSFFRFKGKTQHCDNNS
jgi:hypothetical protein